MIKPNSYAAVMLPVLIVMVIVTGCNPVDSNTQYSSPRVKTSFKEIQKGSTLDEVYAVVGAPLFIHVNPDRFGNGAYRQTREYDVELGHVKRILANSNVEVYLFYSDMMKRSGGHFYLYRVDAREGRVFRLVERDHLD